MIPSDKVMIPSLADYLPEYSDELLKLAGVRKDKGFRRVGQLLMGSRHKDLRAGSSASAAKMEKHFDQARAHLRNVEHLDLAGAKKIVVNHAERLAKREANRGYQHFYRQRRYEQAAKEELSKIHTTRGVAAAGAVGLASYPAIHAGKKLKEQTDISTVKRAAAPKKPKSHLRNTVEAAGLGALGVGAGTAAGFLGGKGIDAALNKTMGKAHTLPQFKYTVPALLAGMAISKALWDTEERETLSGRKDR